MATTAPQPPSTRINREIAAKAVDSLLKWLRAQPKHKQKKPHLSDDDNNDHHHHHDVDGDETIHIILTLKEPPAKTRTTPFLLPLPHPLHPFSTTSICLFVDDRPNSPFPPPSITSKINSQSLPISKVVTFSSLKSEFKSSEARRKLFQSHQLFFTDRRIFQLLLPLLGKEFFKKKNRPLPVDFGRKDWEEQIRRGCESAVMYLGNGTCCHVDVGRVSMGRDGILDNLVAVVGGAAKRVSWRWANVVSVHVKSDESVALPVYPAAVKEGDGLLGNGEVVQGLVSGADNDGLKKNKRKTEDEMLGAKASKKKTKASVAQIGADNFERHTNSV